MRLRCPDFFLLGAPKSGTTSLASYLREHPAIFIPEEKEPGHFHTDFADRYTPNLNQYLRYFAPAPPEALVGEATVLYLASETALLNILNLNPKAKFAVILRNPVDAAISWHSQMLKAGIETHVRFEEAWELQGERASGRKVPLSCREPLRLQYRRIFSYATQIERLCEQTRPEQRLILFFDDLVVDPRAVYARMLGFLDVQHDDRDNFPRFNANRVVESVRVRNAFRFVSAIRQQIPLPSLGMLNALRRKSNRGLRKAARTPIAPELRASVQNAFADDIHHLAELVNRDLSSWLSDP